MYESAGSGYLRQTSKTLPGGNSTTMSYYGATETRPNPCVANSPAVRQAGLIKLKTEPDPDGSGAQTGRVTEQVYDASGAVVATRVGDDPWTCITYNSRDQKTQTLIPASGGRSGRTITNTYNVGGNPFVSSTTDEQGTITTEIDLLGRTVKYKDANNLETTNTYDQNGKLVSRQTPYGKEEFVYNNLLQLIDHKFRDVVYAHVTYDLQGRIANVEYPQAKDPNNAANYLKLAQAYDSYNKQSNQTYTLSSGQQLAENYTRSSQSGTLLQSSQTYNGQTNSWQYTYDSVGRLTNAALTSTQLGNQNYAYNFAASDASCSGLAGSNTNAYKNANRSSQTITKNGISSTTTYCYDQADRLIQTSDPLFSSPAYDSLGNITQIGDSANRLTLGYDAAGRNVSLTHGSSGQAGYINIAYSRDAQGRLAATTSTKADVNNPANTVSSIVKYGYTASGDSPDYLLNGSNQVAEAYLSLPGGALLSVQIDPSSGPNGNGTSNTTQDSTISQTGYILDNLHGDTLAHVSSAGILQNGATIQVYDPFGSRIDSAPTTTPAPTGVTAQSNSYKSN